MQLALVVGTIVATQKHRRFESATLLLVQPITPDETPRGPMLLAVDTVGAGVREKVLIVLDGKAAADAMGRRGTPGRCRNPRYRGSRRLRSRARAAMTDEELRHLVRRVVADRLGTSPQRPARTRITAL